MRCGSVGRKLEGYIAGVLDPRVALAMDAHIASCPTCATELRRAEQVWATLDGDEAPVAHADFNRRLWAEIDAAERQGAALPRWRFAPAVALACAAAVAGLLGAVSGHEVGHAIAPQRQQESAVAEWPTSALERIPTTSLSGAYIEISAEGGA